VDADIEQCFGQLDHEVLMEALRRRIGDGAMLRLMHQRRTSLAVAEGGLSLGRGSA